MALKREFNYQWRLFLPLVICFWASIFGMFRWQNERIRTLRHEMVYDMMRVVTSMYIENQLSPEQIEQYFDFMRDFYRKSDHYDPMAVRVVDANTNKVKIEVGERFDNSAFPADSLGVFEYDRQYGDGHYETNRYIFYSAYTPDGSEKIYVVLPYTKQLVNDINSRNTTFWLIFISIGVIITILASITTSYFGRNIKILRRFAYQAANGELIDVDDYNDFPHDELGDISRQILNLYKKNIEEKKKSEQEHRVAINAIEEKNRTKRELTGNINHELKTPVGIVRGYIDTLVDNPDMDPETRDKFLFKAQEGINRLTELIKDVTEITKLESGGKLVNVGQVNFHDFAFAFSDYVKESGVLQGKMTFNMEMPLNCNIIANESLLNASMLNLVKNAVLYSEGTEIHLVFDKEDEDYYYFKFYDNGVGVPPEHLPHIFERFYRVNAGRSRSAGGTGLGLAIVEITIESFGGTIEVSNHFPSGLEYIIKLQKFSTFQRRKSEETAKLAQQFDRDQLSE